MGLGAAYIGALLLALGSALAVATSKRPIDRTSQFSVNKVPNYWDKLCTQIKDGLLRYVSLFLLPTGLVILGFRYEDFWGWIVTLPVSALTLFLLFGS
jgi:hypothetical protein